MRTNTSTNKKLNTATKIFVAAVCGLLAIISLPFHLNYLRPDLFFVCVIYASLFIDETDFSIWDATFAGLFANLFYPVIFGTLGIIFASAYSIFKVLLPRLKNIDSATMGIIIFIFLFFYQFLLRFIYIYPSSVESISVFLSSILTNFCCWLLIYNFKFKRSKI